MEKELSEKDLVLVLEATHKARTKWYNVGLKLGVESHTLDSIKAEFNDPIECLREVFKPWLKGTNPRATWRALIDALRSCLIGEDKLADQLEAKFCATGQSVQGD